MFWVVENNKQLELFTRLDYDEVFLEPILANDNIHPKLNNIIAIYIRGINAPKGYIVCLDHSETTSCSGFKLNYNKIYVRNKKLCTYFFNTKNFKDLHFLMDFNIDITTPAHTYFNAKFPEKTNVNRIVPIVKHYEKCELIFNEIKDIITKNFPPHFDFFNTKVTNCFYWIEKNGIRINKELLKQNFELNKEIYSLNEKNIYSQYNLYTTTKRPSNSFNGVNFSALKKEGGSRKSFIPENDGFEEIDISAYHPTLISKLIGYEFEEKDIHQHFSELYGVNYQKSKELTFKQLYGGVFKEYEHIEFFKKTKKYIQELHKKYNKEGYIEVPISKYRFEKEKLGDVGAQKLFNYLLQSLETALNVTILWEIIKTLKSKNTKLVHYCYDSFLFDVDNSEEEVLKEIKLIFKKNKLKIKEVRGLNYGEMA